MFLYVPISLRTPSRSYRQQILSSLPLCLTWSILKCRAFLVNHKVEYYEISIGARTAAEM